MLDLLSLNSIQNKNSSVSNRESHMNTSVKSSKISFSEVMEKLNSKDDKKGYRPCEYFKMDDGSGMIKYGRTTFMCDYKRNRLTLGDVSNEDNCLNIPLSKGGSLTVNRNNISDLLQSLPMFSEEDQAIILKAIQDDRIAQQAKTSKKMNRFSDSIMKIVEVAEDSVHKMDTSNTEDNIHKAGSNEIKANVANYNISKLENDSKKSDSLEANNSAKDIFTKEKENIRVDLYYL